MRSLRAVSVVANVAALLEHGKVNCDLAGLGPLVFVAGEAEIVALERQTNLRFILVLLHRVAGIATGLRRGVDNLPGSFVGVALRAGREVRLPAW